MKFCWKLGNLVGKVMKFYKFPSVMSVCLVQLYLRGLRGAMKVNWWQTRSRRASTFGSENFVARMRESIQDNKHLTVLEVG